MDETKSRLPSIDIVRGVVMVLMAIDHVRVYSGLPAGGPTAGIFFTRWVTHFCAPAFVFFAGTSAFLDGTRMGRPSGAANAAGDARGERHQSDAASAVARFLITRGLMLVVFELTVIRFAWTFNVDYGRFVLAGVIWMLGWCMVMLAALVRLRARTVGLIGLAIMLFQQVFHVLPRVLPESVRQSVGPIYEFFYPAGLQRLSGIAI